jgi:hypothetical protein
MRNSLRILSLAAFAVALFFLASCTTYPPRPNAKVSVPIIADSVLNELNCAVRDLRDWNKTYAFNPNDDWTALVDLSLQASIEGSVSPSISLLGPFNSVKATSSGATVGSYTAAFGASFDQTRTSLRDYKFYVDINKLSGDNNTLRGNHCHPSFEKGIYLAGKLGLEEWLGPAVEEQQLTRQFLPPPPPPQAGQAIIIQAPRTGLRRAAPFVLTAATGSSYFPTISATFTFTIKASGNAGPSFVLSNVSGGSSSLFSANRTDTNFANIVLTPTSYLLDSKLQPTSAPLPDADAAAETRLENGLLALQLSHLLPP